MIGSTGRHYTVELADERHTCQCPDFRMRRRACKHIKLVLQQLGISENSQDWHKVQALHHHHLLHALRCAKAACILPEAMQHWLQLLHKLIMTLGGVGYRGA